MDAACVYVNASTRFTDGGEFGMGAEIGNSTQKLHARGPIGLRELCTFKYVVEGDGHVRPLSRRARGASASSGGTFNPPHIGHVCDRGGPRPALALDRVVLMPVAVPPHKEAEGDPGAEHRLELCRLAVRDDERFAVSRLEVERGGPSYTVDTLEAAPCTSIRRTT